jgi:ubiquinone/menaquinone biosynthesis C-methylase UbiE
MNVDSPTVEGFGDEWTRFDQASLPAEERRSIFESYFSIFPWDLVGHQSVGVDVGCGSGRWAALVAPRVGRLHCVDPSRALDVARRNLAACDNVSFHRASVGELPFAEASLDFAYSLGVLHHVPDTPAAVRSVARVLRRGAPLLLYLYYAFDNRPAWYRRVWRVSEAARTVVSRLPHAVRYPVSQAIAVTVYWPLARTARVLEKGNVLPASFPLAAYRDRSFYTMRTDALDRFGTRLEQRFTRTEISEMMRQAGFRSITFSDRPPFWCAVGIRE